MKYKVKKQFIRISEGGKQYNPGDTVEISDKHVSEYLLGGYVVKEEKATRTTKEHKPKGKRSK